MESVAREKMSCIVLKVSYSNRLTARHASSSSTDKILPAGSLNHAIFGPPPRKIPFSSVTRPVPATWDIRSEKAP